jgi:hypothetical protein
MMVGNTADIAAESSLLSFTSDEAKQLQHSVQDYLVLAFRPLPLLLQDNVINISLADHVVQLTELATEKRIASREELELSAIRSNVRFNDFYFMMYQTLNKSVTSCQALASGLVAHRSDDSVRSWLFTLVKEGAWESLKALPPFHKIVTGAVKWASQQFPLPFGDFCRHPDSSPVFRQRGAGQVLGVGQCGGLWSGGQAQCGRPPPDPVSGLSLCDAQRVVQGRRLAGICPVADLGSPIVG